MKIHNVEQRSEEWHELRINRITASDGYPLFVGGVGLVTIINNKLAKKYSSGSNEEEEFINNDMARGIELEEQAREVYLLDNSNDKIEEVGFVEYNEYVGCSPDGFLNDNQLIEIKCPNDFNYFELLTISQEELENKIKKTKKNYYYQIQMNLLICEKESCKLMFYNPNFKKNYIIIEIKKDEKVFEKLLENFKLAEDLFKEKEKQYFINIK
jgi:putative phage-type endonuclease